MQTVGVLRGGAGGGHEGSLESGAAMLAALSPERYRVRDIYIDKKGQWHAEGRATSPDKVLRQLDLALLPLHGAYGESGELQRLLGQFGVRYVGSDAFATNQARHKVIGKTLAQEVGLKTPEFRLVTDVSRVDTAAAEIIRAFHQPVVVRPVGQSASEGATVVGGYSLLATAIRMLLRSGAEGVLVEEFVRGPGASVHILEGLRGEKFYAFPPVEFAAPPGVFAFDGAHKREVHASCPGRFTRVQAEELVRAARLMHRTLGLRHCSRSDFIVSPRGVYYLDTTSLPPVSRGGAFALAGYTVGLSLPTLLEHLLEQAAW